MEELRVGYQSNNGELMYIRDKINEIVRWINAHEAEERSVKESKEDRTEEILNSIGECLRAYGDRENNLEGYPFARDFDRSNCSIEVTIRPEESPRGERFDMTVRVRPR